MHIQTIISTPSGVQQTDNAFDLSSAIDLAQKLWWVFIICVIVISALWLYFRIKKEIAKKAQEMNGFSKNEIKEYVPPLLSLCNTSGVSSNNESLSYRKVVKYIAEREYPHKGDKTTSPLYFVFANPACGKTKFAMNLCTRLTLRYWRKNLIIKLANKQTGEIHTIDPVSKVKFFRCRKFNSATDNFEELKSIINKNPNSVLIFDGFDELLPNSASVESVAWRKEKLFEIIDMIDNNDNGNTIVITYRTADNANLKSEVSAKSLSDRSISRLEIYEYNQDYVSEKVAIKYAKRVFAVNNRKFPYNYKDEHSNDKITFWKKTKIKKAIKTLYKVEDAKGKRTGKFIALPLYSAYAHILLDVQDLRQLSKTTYFEKMVDVLLNRECDKYCRNKEQSEKDVFKEELKINLTKLAVYFDSQIIHEISSSDPMIEKFGADLPTLFLQCIDNDTKYEFQHDEFITYFSGLDKADRQKRSPGNIYTILEDGLQPFKGNHLSFSCSPHITWRILDYKNRENKVLLISEQILSLRAFNVTEHKGRDLNDWDASDIKAYLNSDFLEEVFNNEERAKIQGEDQDKIFLLSIDEVKTYFSSNEDRIAYCCEETEDDLKAKARKEISCVKDSVAGLRSAEQRASWWWLRSPGFYSHIAAFVLRDGNVHVPGIYVLNDSGGVRPALWLNL